MKPTSIQFLGFEKDNKLYIKRDDLIPYSFGGNKARKGFLFFNEIDKGEYDCVVTYGSSHSNHCRIISNLAAERNMPCILIQPKEVSNQTFNTMLLKLFGAEIVTVPVNEVHSIINSKMDELRCAGKNPFFIPGGGHGNIGTEAYIRAYEEIKEYEHENGILFDYIFLASGTGTTQAGLVCGQIKHNDNRKIIGISIARKSTSGRKVILNSIEEYMPEADKDKIQERTIFLDDFIGDGYGRKNYQIENVIKDVLIRYGIPLDYTYTGKAFWGMKTLIEQEKIIEKNILFIHTGGTPLFFDDLQNL